MLARPHAPATSLRSCFSRGSRARWKRIDEHAHTPHNKPGRWHNGEQLLEESLRSPGAELRGIAPGLRSLSNQRPFLPVILRKSVATWNHPGASVNSSSNAAVML